MCQHQPRNLLFLRQILHQGLQKSLQPFPQPGPTTLNLLLLLTLIAMMHFGKRPPTGTFAPAPAILNIILTLVINFRQDIQKLRGHIFTRDTVAYEL